MDYLGEQFVVELKIWHGNEYHERGYLLSFNFNKEKEVGVREIRIGGKVIVEAVV